MLHTTKDGSLKGKFGYMAPEQASSQPMDRRADVFVLGVVLYELTTRTKLFKAQTDSETMQKVLTGQITPPSQVDPSYPKELEQVVLRALRRDPAERFQTAEEMQAAIEKFIVTHGDPVLTSQVGKMMRDIFVDRIKKKKRVLSAVKDDSLQALPNVDFGDVPDVDMERSSQSTWFTRFTGTLARRRTAMIVGGVAVLCGLGIFFGYPLLTGNGSTASHHPGSSTRASTRAHPDAGPPAPRTVSIGVQVTPRTARLRFAGKRVSNPYTFKGAAAERRVEVVAAAPGYKTKRVKVSLGRDTQLMLELSKLEPAPQPEPEPAAKQGEPGEPPRSARARNQKKRRKKGKKKLADDDVLVNPYH
jgi:hypothetical protein